MFEQRLRILLVAFVAGWIIVALRLFQLQVLRADHYREVAQERLIRDTRLLEPIRGSVLDRHGRVLASDEPAWAVALHYRLLADDQAYYALLARRVRREPRHLAVLARNLLRLHLPQESLPEELVEQLAERLKSRIDGPWVHEQIETLWQQMAERFSPAGVADLKTKADEIVQEVQRWKSDYVRRHHLDAGEADQPQLEEEQRRHRVVAGLNHDQHIAAQKLIMDHYEWLVDLGAVEIVDSRQRVYHSGDCAAHVIGQLREVARDDLEARPYRRGDVIDWGGYRPRDWIGATGIEQTCETQLRGERGWMRVYYDSRGPQRIEPEHGTDVRLTIDYDLQRQVYDLLAARVAEVSAELATEAGVVPPEPPAAGGSVVILDIPSREVLALVSYPGFDPNHYYDHIAELSTDVLRYPLHFRAIHSQYEPGSIVKPITITAGHGAGLIDQDTLMECRGKMFPDHPAESFRCWRPAGSSRPMHHGVINSRDAIKGSCNVFCFKVGQLFCDHYSSATMGVQRMCEWMDLFGIGRRTGIELQRESRGILPTPSYLASVKGRTAYPSDARFYAIGQAELQITPLQAANIAAIYASGENRPVTILAGQDQRPTWILPVQPPVWQIVREGMYGVVNESGGTARRYARLEHPDFVLCGKSGSAEKLSRWVTTYRVEYADQGQTAIAIVPADSEAAARRAFDRRYPGIEPLNLAPLHYWPPLDPAERQALAEGRNPSAARERKHSHAWFVGFIQPRRADGFPDWQRPARVAIAVLLEFGGSGGVTSGPLFRDIAERIIEQFPRYVEPSTVVARQTP